jgi:hypothetical protein
MVAPNAESSIRPLWTGIPRTLLAAFTLLLTATHCVEIDDRDLDEHPAEDDGGGGTGRGGTGGVGGTDGGGTGGTGGNPIACEPDTDDTTCGVCLKQNCCTQLVNCAESDECVGFSDCIYTCGTSSACVEYCYSEFPDGLPLFSDLLDCNVSLCTTECGGDA